MTLLPTIFHLTIILLAWAGFGLAFLIWRQKIREGKKVSEAWKFFTTGLFFMSLAEMVDLFSGLHRQVFAGINFYSETTEAAGLCFLFLGIILFLRRRMR